MERGRKSLVEQLSLRKGNVREGVAYIPNISFRGKGEWFGIRRAGNVLSFEGEFGVVIWLCVAGRKPE